MPVFSRLFPATILASVLVVGALIAATPPASSATCQNWQPQPKNPSTGDAELLGVETASPCATWAVGYATNTTTGFRQTLIEKWNGYEWKTQSISNSGDVTTGAIAGGTLYDLAGTSTSNMWAVGHFSLPGQSPAGLFVRWNGNKWQRYQTPLDDPIWESEILGVAAVSKNSFWAVGHSFDNSEEEHRAVIFHWNGNKNLWKPAKIELPASLEGVDITLNSVAGPSSGPAYAVGSYAGIGSRRQTLILKWNNSVWKRVPNTPNVQQRHNVLTSVSVLGNNTWASGYTENPENPAVGSPIILRRDGSQWKRATVIAPGEETPITDVVQVPGGTWAAGYSTCVVACDPDKVSALIMKRDNQGIFQPLPAQSFGTDNRLHAMDASSHRNVWVVGSYREVSGGPLRTYAFKGGFCC
jgi:hypothetical protein